VATQGKEEISLTICANILSKITPGKAIERDSGIQA
jgi:hypothetical protein